MLCDTCSGQHKIDEAKDFIPAAFKLSIKI